MSSYSTSRLRLGENFSTFPQPQIQPVEGAPHILIIGGGVTGLTTAWVLLDRGYHVTLLSKQWASDDLSRKITSQIAGALWEFPPAVCGQHTDAISLSRSKRWCIVAYHIWNTIANSPDLEARSGVRMKRSAFFFPEKLENDPAQLHKFEEITASSIFGVNRDVGLAHEHNVNLDYGVVDAYEHLAPIIDTDVGMNWLKELVHQKGAKFITETITGDIFLKENYLCQRFCAQAVVNATGLAGKELAGDSTCYPIRGALIRVINDGHDFPKVKSALTITADAVHDSNEIVFIVPRNDNILLLGGIAQYHEDKLDLSLESPIVARMRARCEAFLPGLKNARLDEHYPLAQGLRPFRQRNVRVERELREHIIWESGNEVRASLPSRVVHSYGQGGAGWSLSFGCAEDVACLVEDALRGLRAEPMEAFMKRFNV